MECDGWKHYLVAIWAFFETMLFAGFLYGWAPLVWVLKHKNVYASICLNMDSDNGLTMNSSGYFKSYNNNRTQIPAGYRVDVEDRMQEQPCKDQDEKLEQCFTVGASVFCVSAFIFGLLNYKLHTRITRLCSMPIFTAGCLMFAFTDESRPWLVFLALSFVSLGGLPILITNLQIQDLFPKRSSTIVGLLCGAFDCSAGIQLLIKIAYENGVDIKISYFLLTGLYVLMFGMSTLVFLSKSFIERRGQDFVEETRDENIDEPLQNELNANQNNRHVFENEIEDSHEGKILEKLSRTTIFLYFVPHVVWFCILQVRFSYFLGSINTYLNRITNENNEKVSFFTDVMIYIMLGGLISSFGAGVVYDWQRKKFEKSRLALRRNLMPAILPLSITCGLAVLLSVLVLIPHEEVLYLEFIIMTLFRSFLYSIGVRYLSATFPDKFFGLLYGVWMLIGGIAGVLLFPFVRWAQSYPGAPFHVDIFLLCFVSVSFLHPVFQFFNCRRKKSFSSEN